MVIYAWFMIYMGFIWGLVIYICLCGVWIGFYDLYGMNVGFMISMGFRLFTRGWYVILEPFRFSNFSRYFYAIFHLDEFDHLVPSPCLSVKWIQGVSLKFFHLVVCDDGISPKKKWSLQNSQSGKLLHNWWERSTMLLMVSLFLWPCSIANCKISRG